MDNILKALMLCRDAEGNHVELANPHYYKMPNGQMVAFASDAHIMLICKNVEGFFDKFDFEPTCTPNIASVIPTDACNQELVVLKLCEIFAHVPILPYKWATCKECDGLGEVEWAYNDNKGGEHTGLFNCPICDGKGLVKRPGQTIDENFAIGIGGQQIGVLTIDKLINIFNLLAIERMPMVVTPVKTKFENDDYIIVVSHIIHECRKPSNRVFVYE